jgi:tetratricopeptide (TPR) repeat protein
LGPVNARSTASAAILLALVASGDPDALRAQGAAARTGQAAGADAVAAAEKALAAGQPEEAMEMLAPVLKRDGKNARALLARSTANCQMGELADCRKDLDRALAIDPTLRQGWLNRSALAIADKRYDDALAALAEAERLDPAAPDNALNQGAVLLLQGQLEAASARFERHLAAQPRSADAYYLVATNFALAGYSALAVQHLGRAIELDERSRVRARGDANFADMGENRAFAQLLATDSFRIAPGSAIATRVYRTRYRGGASPLLTAVLNTLQLARTPMDPRVEVTDDWALLWADVRIKLVKRGEEETAIELSAPPGAFTEAAWNRRSRELFEAVDLELLKQEKRAPAP